MKENERSRTAAQAASDAGDTGPLRYQSGFGNEFATEALPGALPQGQNSPQVCPYGLYAEQISGTAFTAPRASNRRTWTYRMRPAAVHKPFRKIEHRLFTNAFDGMPTPNQLRWDPLPMPSAPTDFIDGLVTMAGNGDPATQSGCGIHIYAANKSMTDRFFYNADGELLIVPQQGRLRIATEMGVLDVEPLEIALIPRGVRFRVELLDAEGGSKEAAGGSNAATGGSNAAAGGSKAVARGYVCENFGAAFRLPDLGPIGSNCLANPRDFLAPTAAYEDREGKFELVAKFGGQMWAAEIGHSPLDVVAWHGNYTPYKYDLRRFNVLGSTSFDHPDPSIYLVLQAQSDTPGVDMIDFVIFPPRWMVAEHTFRPPWYHRNIASEFMGLIHGMYDSKAEGFVPGGSSLHNCMAGHGPDEATFQKGSTRTLTPDHIEGTMAFMFETRLPIRPTRHALEAPQLQAEYYQCWQGLKKHFNPDRP